MKTLITLALVVCAGLTCTACNTWSGIKQDAKEVGHAAGKGIEKAGEKIQEVAN